MMYHILNIPIWWLYSAHQICFFSRIAIVKTLLAFVWYVGEDKLIRLLVHYVGKVSCEHFLIRFYHQLERYEQTRCLRIRETFITLNFPKLRFLYIWIGFFL